MEARLHRYVYKVGAIYGPPERHSIKKLRGTQLLREIFILASFSYLQLCSRWLKPFWKPYKSLQVQASLRTLPNKRPDLFNSGRKYAAVVR